MKTHEKLAFYDVFFDIEHQVDKYILYYLSIRLYTFLTINL